MIQPLEVFTPKHSLSPRTKSVIQFFCETSRDRVRHEETNDEKFFNIKDMDTDIFENGSTAMTQMYLNLTGEEKSCLSALKAILSEFGMDNLLVR